MWQTMGEKAWAIQLTRHDTCNEMSTSLRRRKNQERNTCDCLGTSSRHLETSRGGRMRPVEGYAVWKAEGQEKMIGQEGTGLATGGCGARIV
jgi:hypothetical protein